MNAATKGKGKGKKGEGKKGYGECWHCGEWGHPRRECPKLLAQQNSKGAIDALRVGKGKGKKGFKFWRGKNQMSLDERRKRLKDLKARTKCQACGKVGHWAGDPECPLKGKTPQNKKPFKPKTGHMAARESDCSSVNSSSDDSDPEHRSGYMVYKASGSSMHFKMDDDSEEETVSPTRNEKFINPPKFEMPAGIQIKNRKQFKKLMTQVFENVTSEVKSLKIDKASLVVAQEAEAFISNVEEVVMVKSNQTEPIDVSTLIEDQTKPSATYIPLSEPGSFCADGKCRIHRDQPGCRDAFDRRPRVGRKR